MELKWYLLSGVALCGVLCANGAAFADAGAERSADAVETVVVTGDRAHLIETTPSDTAVGLDLTPIETPRAITIVSDTTLERYGIDSIDSLTAIVPNSYTSSYFGVQGSVNLRGTMAENYFRGFKRVENRGTYTTPIGDAAQIEILRGPPSSVYGNGKIGGLLNFIPKTAIKDGRYITEITGNVTATYGSYEKRNLGGQIGIPVDLGFAAGGIYAYGELDDSFSYYRGIHPSHQMLQFSSDFDLGDGWNFSSDYMYYHSNGDVQTPGWNRLTQDLIDHQTYITGRDTSLTDADGNGRITLDEMGGNPYKGTGKFKTLYLASTCKTCSDAWHSLDVGVGTTKLSPRTIYVAKGIDFSNTYTHTGYAEISKRFENGGTFKLEGFTDTMSNQRYVSYGYPADFKANIYEARASYLFDVAAFDGALTAKNIAGASFRYVRAIKRESYNSGAIALDRRDIAYGPTANDIVDSPFGSDPSGAVGLGWENDVRSDTRNTGVFYTGNVSWQDTVHLLIGARYDLFGANAVDVGVLPYEVGSGKDNRSAFSYSASLSYKAPFGLIPYVTYAKSSSLEINQSGGISPSLLAANTWVSDSFLSEGGLKFDLLDSHLVGALSYYRQQRTKVVQSTSGDRVVGTVSKGEELEIRYVVNQNYSVTLVGNMQHTLVRGDTGFTYIPSRLVGVAGASGFGGTYVVWNQSTLKGWSTDYDYTLMPHGTASAYATYTSDPFSWGEAGLTFGGTYVSKTTQVIPNPLVFHPYLTLNASAFVRYSDWEADLNVNNLTDKLYFTADNSSYINLGALPSQGRVWRLTLKYAY
jgi:iron complex outermembrane recepter protein